MTAPEDLLTQIRRRESFNKAPTDLPITDMSACTLKCHNNGACIPGRPLHGFASELLEDEVNLRFVDQKSRTMHCICPPLYTGLYCEIKLVECPEDKMCHSGRECQVSEDDRGQDMSHCECDALDSDLSAMYATHFCGEISTSYCSLQGSTTKHSYCRNGGRCRGFIHDGQNTHRGCDCTEDWEGPHCEFLKGTYYSAQQPTEQSDRIAFALFGIGIAVLVLLVVGFFAWHNRQAAHDLPTPKSKNAPDSNTTTRAFLDADQEPKKYNYEEEESYEGDESEDHSDGSYESSEDDDDDDEEVGASAAAVAPSSRYQELDPSTVATVARV